MRVALVTCLQPPEPDPDERLLVAAVGAGADAEIAAWDDDAVDWSAYDLCVLRSTWNYHRVPDRFLAWLDRASAVTRLANPPEVVRWNHHKGYLLELAARGVPAAPTVLLRAGADARLADVMAAQGWADVVVKPAISAGSRATRRVRGADPAGEAHLADLLAREDALVQPYLRAVETHGERSLVWIAGELTHSMRKRPRFDQEHEAVEGPLPIAPEARALAEAALAPIAASLLYGRIDVAPDDDGRLRVMEVEVIEPSLFLAQHPPALERFAEAICRRAASRF